MFTYDSSEFLCLGVAKKNCKYNIINRLSSRFVIIEYTNKHTVLYIYTYMDVYILDIV